MIIAIEYKNGRMKEFDTSAFTATIHGFNFGVLI